MSIKKHKYSAILKTNIYKKTTLAEFFRNASVVFIIDGSP